MIFLHIIDDYILQGILASMKQKEWWQKNAPEKLYKYDYIIALLAHSFEWAFMIMLPFALKQHFHYSEQYLTMIAFNTAIHAFVDDLKANKKVINLIADQTAHLAQIVFTYLIMTYC